MSDGYSRRTFLKAAGGTAAAAAAGGAAINTASARSGSFVEAASATSKTLYGVSMTSDGPYAVGKTGDILTRKTLSEVGVGSSGAWKKVVDAGPHARSSGLRTVAVTDDGKRIWFAGGSGALGAYDVETATKYDYSAPGGKTSTWEAISLTGNRDEETIYVANGSGEILIGTHDSKGCVSWKTNGSLNVAKPGGGSRTPAIDFREDGVSTGHVVDTSSQTYVTNDSGGSWENVGIPDSQVGLYDVISYKTSSGLERVYVAGGGGKLYRLDCNCQNWTPIQIGSKALRCITRDGTDRLVTGASGNIFENVGDGWTPKESPIGAMLYEATYGNSTYPDVIVGSSGNILER
jgi:hypothetical protein